MDSLSFDFDLREEPPADQAPAAFAGIVPRATVRQLVEQRDRTLALYREAFGALDTARAALATAAEAFRGIDSKDGANRYAYSTREEEKRFLTSLDLPTRDEYAALARKVVDRVAWSALVRLTDLESLMDKKAKDQLRADLQETVPEVTEDNVWATLESMLADADTIFKRGIANAFSNLDRRFRSHDGWKIGSRVILFGMFDQFGWFNYHRNHRDTLHDIDRTFHVLDGNPSPDMLGGIVAVLEQSRRDYRARQTECESDYFRIRAFKNGNAHIWFKRDDLVAKVNRLLADYYGAAIPEERQPTTDGGLHTPKTSLAKGYGFFPTPDALADRIMAEEFPACQAGHRFTVLEPSAGTGQLARRAAARGHTVDCIEVQPDLCDRLSRAGTYRRVTCADFLTVLPSPAYDVVLMNPPFDRERDIDHVMHALRFLKPDGQLVAIMSAGTEVRDTAKSRAFRAHMRKLGARFQDLPAGSFASVGTYVNTIAIRTGDGARYWGRAFAEQQ